MSHERAEDDDAPLQEWRAPSSRPRHRRAGRLAGSARHRRQRGVAGDHRPFPPAARRRAVARHLLRAGLRLADAGVRQAGRPVRSSPDLPHRPGDLGRRLRRLRRRAGLAAFPVGAGRPGGRHGAGAVLHAGARHVAVSRKRAHPGAGRLRQHHGVCRRRRPAPGRRAGRTVGLAGGLLDPRADRAGDARLVGPAAVAQAGFAAVRCAGRGAARGLHERAPAVAGAVAAPRRRRRLGSHLVRGLARGAVRLCPPRQPRARADHPAHPVRRCRVRGAQRHERAGQPRGIFHPAADALLPGERPASFRPS